MDFGVSAWSRGVAVGWAQGVSVQRRVKPPPAEVDRACPTMTPAVGLSARQGYASCNHVLKEPCDIGVGDGAGQTDWGDAVVVVSVWGSASATQQRDYRTITA